MDDRLTQAFGVVLQVEDMPTEDLQWMAKLVGVPATMEILQRYSGLPLYLPKGAVDRLKKSYVQRVYNGENSRELARRVGIAERTMYAWLNEPVKRVVVADAEQVRLF